LTTLVTASVLVALFTTGVATAPAQAVAQISLSDAVSRTLARNPRLQAAERAIEAARARETQAGAAPNPNFTVSVDQVPIPDPRDGNYMVGVSQPLLLGGQREARVEVARLDTQLAELDRDILRQDLTAQTKDAYAQVLFEIARTQQAQVDAQAADVLYKAMVSRYEAGAIPRVEVLQAEVERNRASREFEAAKNRLLLSRGPLNVLLGREATAELAVSDLPTPEGDRIPGLPLMVTTAIERRVELKRAELLIERETLSRRLAQSGVWTGTEVNGLVGAVQGMPGFSASVTLPIPFYRQQGEVAEAEANRARAEAERDALRNEIAQQVDQAYREASVAAKEANAFGTLYLPQAQRLVRNADDRFREGEGTRLEVTEAWRSLRETQLELQQALLRYRQALHRLERAVGIPLILNDAPVNKETPRENR
jgi:cobalt-zinc-cadmium efflux system outer membrane protein